MLWFSFLDVFLLLFWCGAFVGRPQGHYWWLFCWCFFTFILMRENTENAVLLSRWNLQVIVASRSDWVTKYIVETWVLACHVFTQAPDTTRRFARRDRLTCTWCFCVPHTNEENPFTFLWCWIRTLAPPSTLVWFCGVSSGRPGLSRPGCAWTQHVWAGLAQSSSCPALAQRHGLRPWTVAAPVSALDNCNSAQILFCSCDDYTNGPNGATYQFAYATLALARVYQAKCMTMLQSPFVPIQFVLIWTVETLG